MTIDPASHHSSAADHTDPVSIVPPLTRLAVRELVAGCASTLELNWIAGEAGADRLAAVPLPDTVDQVGYINLVHPHRIQVIGKAEVAYFERLTASRRQFILDELIAGRPPAIFLADGALAPPALVHACDRHALPLLASSLPSSRTIELLRKFLVKALAVGCTMHGVLMDVLGMGVLISGESGLGKSELALELISRGHGLVADDVVELQRFGPNTIEGRSPPLLQGLLEVRGLGLLDVKTVFGETAVRRKIRLKMIVHLMRRSTNEDDYERLPLESITQDILGIAVPKVVIPVAAGRNLAVLTEAAVRNTILQLRGIETMREFIERQQAAIAGRRI